MSRWFRHYAGLMRDEKLVAVAMRAKQPVERVIWIWGAILESAAEINDNGKFALDTAEAAYFLRADQAELDCILRTLEELGRLAAQCVVKWGDRQFSSDRSAERTRDYRARRKQGDEIHRENVTKTMSDDHVTAQKRHGDAPETELDTETEKIPEAKASAADAAPEPVGEEPKAKLFRIGKTILVSFGVAEKRTGALIGQWLKRADPAGLLAAIQYARDQNVADPVAYVSTLVHSEKSNGRGQQPSLGDTARELAEQARHLEREAGLLRSDAVVGRH